MSNGIQIANKKPSFVLLVGFNDDDSSQRMNDTIIAINNCENVRYFIVNSFDNNFNESVKKNKYYQGRTH